MIQKEDEGFGGSHLALSPLVTPQAQRKPIRFRGRERRAPHLETAGAPSERRLGPANASTEARGIYVAVLWEPTREAMVYESIAHWVIVAYIPFLRLLLESQ